MKRKTKKKILHITTHLGGGIGSVVLNYLTKTAKGVDFAHAVVCLGYVDDRATSALKEAGIPFTEHMSAHHQEILAQIENSDIVLIHWWNHPLLSDFLMREELPPSRVIIWSHVAGATAPNNLTDKILKYPDLFVFTTPLSHMTKDVERLDTKRKKCLRDIWSTGTVDRIKSLKPTKHSGFNIGYVGTVDFAKMHPDFLKMSSRANIPNVKFIVIGPPNGAQMAKEAERLGIGAKFNFTGPLPEKEAWRHLASCDVFGYPLVPSHYGTCDLALQEAMTAGVVPVVLANPMESYMVQDRVTGIVAKDTDEYVKALEELYHNPKLRRTLSKNAREYAIRTFSLKKMTDDWEQVFHEILALPKTPKRWRLGKKSDGITPKDVFLESLGRHKGPFADYCKAANKEDREKALAKIRKLAKLPAWQSETKSTVHNYNTFLPGDRYLSFWSKVMKEAIGGKIK